ncbi:hypothetical protein RI129_008415 [Pyrocoelia pectoralis]|uniref:Glutathione S-transferase n=1 Tax=Pyrocoelia pectoralis TaxID=417401 RepID=A0AAN7ZK60_9COLE
MGLILYTFDMSSSCVSVYFTQAALGLSCKRIQVNVWNKEFSPELIKINPQHIVPTLNDSDCRTISDSHAINIYLCETYGKTQTLYPENPEEQALVNDKLFFNASVVYPLLQKFQMILVRREALSEKNVAKMCEVYKMLDNFLKARQWITGDSVNLADFGLIPNVTLANLFVPINFQKYPNVARWIKNAEQLPFYHENINHLNMFSKFLEERRRVVKSVL